MKTSCCTNQAEHNEDEYEHFLHTITEHFFGVLNKNGSQLFITDASNLFQMFLDHLPAEVRQHYTCNACRHFVDRYGGIVSISDSGETEPVMWPHEVPELYQASVNAVRKQVQKAKVAGVFLTDQKIWGQPVTGEWHHMAVVPPKNIPTTDAPQKSAEKREDYKMLIAGLLEFPLPAVEQAIKLLKTDSLYRSEKCLGVAEFLKEVHEKRSSTKNSAIKANHTWVAVALAPAGFCHVRSTMIGTLLEDIVAGLPFEDIQRRFADKMHPLQYQRPQAPPSAGNIAQAEKIVEKLGIAPSLARRFARLEEIETIWKPAPRNEAHISETGVFSHLKARNKTPETKSISIPTITMTWEKFYRTVLPEAERIEFEVPIQGSFSALVTASNPDAPPILQWDIEERRNPFSWYVYIRDSLAHNWGLTPKTACTVTGVCFQPSMWDDAEEKFSHHGKSVFFLLEGAKDSRINSLGLFPNHLKSELHGIRGTIEAYSKSGIIESADEATACGIRLQKGLAWDALFRVTSKLGQVNYKLDRWD